MPTASLTVKGELLSWRLLIGCLHGITKNAGSFRNRRALKTLAGG